MKSKNSGSIQAGMKRNMLPISGKHFALLHGTLLLYSVVTVFAKYAANHLAAGNMGLSYLFLALEFASLLVYTLLWQQVLKRMPLSFAYSSKAVCTLWVVLLGFFFFGEALTLGKVAGLLVVLAGVWLVVTDHEQ